jgi:hypothetical protein
MRIAETPFCFACFSKFLKRVEAGYSRLHATIFNRTDESLAQLLLAEEHFLAGIAS